VKKILFGILMCFSAMHVYAESIIKITDELIVTAEVSEDWTLAEKQSPPGLPVKTVTLDKNGHKIIITFFGSNKDGTPVNKTENELATMVTTISQQRFVPDSVEGEVNLKSISNENIKGSYASFTDKRLVGKEVPPGEYAFVTTGMFLVDGIMATVTLLSPGVSGATYSEGLNIIKSLKNKS
jgi:hypothetical protein